MPSPPLDAGATADPPDDERRALEHGGDADAGEADAEPDADAGGVAHGKADADADTSDRLDGDERGDEADPDGDVHDAPDATSADRAGDAVASRPWGRISAIVSLVYVAAYVIDLVVLRRDAGSFNAVHRFLGGTGARVVLCAVLLAVLFHLLDGLRVTLEDMAPRLHRHDLALRTAVRFVLLAAWIPAAAAVLWPVVKTWVAR